MQLPSELPAEHSAGFCSGFVWRARKRAAAYFHAWASAIHFNRPSATRRLLILSLIFSGIVCGAIAVFFLSSRAGASPAVDARSKYWETISRVDLKNLATIGKNPYFNLEPGYRLRYTNGEATRTLTVRRKTKVVEGVETRVVEEKEESHGQPTKVVWRYYALDKTTSALYCFGVHTQTYFQGRLLSNSGWRSGKNGAMFTLVLPAEPKLGDTLLRNHSPGSPHRQEAILDVAEKVVTPAGSFINCVCTETKGRKQDKVKIFAPGVGLVQDGPFTLVKVVQTVPRRKAKLAAN